jgi:hypothetical protein
MYRPSGITVVTAGLGALVLAHVVLSWGTKRGQPWPQQIASTSEATLDIGAAFQLHSGAWRAWPAVAEETTPPPSAPAGYLAPEAPMAFNSAPTAAEAQAVPAALSQSQVRKVPIQQISPVEKAVPFPQAFTTEPVEPLAPTADKAPAAPTTPPLAAGRMALSGPEAEATHSHDGYARHPAQPARSAPKANERDPASVADPAPSKPKFGPEIIFKQLDGAGGS